MTRLPVVIKAQFHESYEIITFLANLRTSLKTGDIGHTLFLKFGFYLTHTREFRVLLCTFLYYNCF